LMSGLNIFIWGWQKKHDMSRAIYMIKNKL
jgi:hypothetical protein